MSAAVFAGGALAAYVLYCPLLAMSQKDVPEQSANYNFLIDIFPTLGSSTGANIDSQNLSAVLFTGLVAGAGARYMGYL